VSINAAYQLLRRNSVLVSAKFRSHRASGECGSNVRFRRGSDLNLGNSTRSARGAIKCLILRLANALAPVNRSPHFQSNNSHCCERFSLKISPPNVEPWRPAFIHWQSMDHRQAMAATVSSSKKHRPSQHPSLLNLSVGATLIAHTGSQHDSESAVPPSHRNGRRLRGDNDSDLFGDRSTISIHSHHRGRSSPPSLPRANNALPSDLALSTHPLPRFWCRSYWRLLSAVVRLRMRILNHVMTMSLPYSVTGNTNHVVPEIARRGVAFATSPGNCDFRSSL